MRRFTLSLESSIVLRTVDERMFSRVFTSLRPDRRMKISPMKIKTVLPELQFGHARAFLSLLVVVVIVIACPVIALGGSGNPRLAYVTNGGNTDGNGSVSLIDVDTLNVVGTVPLAGYPVGIAVIPNRDRLYVSGLLSNTVTVFNTNTLAVVATIP